MATTVGGIRVRILGDDSDLQKKLGDSTKQLAKYGAAAAAAGAAVATALTVQGLKAVDSQAKLARSLDTSIDSLRALKIAAGDAGLEGLEGSLARLNRRLGAAEMGMGDAAKSVEALGLNLSELSGMDADERIAAIADAVRDSGVSMQQAARHAQNLGFEQAEAAAFFMQGGEAIRSYRGEVESLGLSLSDIDAAKVEAANDAFARFGLLMEGVQQQLAVQVAPLLTAVSRLMVDGAEDAGGLGNATADAFNLIIEAGAEAANGIAKMDRQFLRTEAALDVFALEVRNGFLEIAREIVEIPTGAVNELIMALNSMGADIDLLGLSDMGREVQNVIDGTRQEITQINEDLAEEMAKPLPGDKFKRFVFEAREAAERAAIELQAVDVPDVGGGQTDTRTDAEREEEAKKQEQMKARLEEQLQSIRDANATELELLNQKFAAENEALNEALEQELLTKQEWAELSREQKARQEEELTAIEEKAADARTKIAEAEAKAKMQALGGALSDLSTLMNSESRKMFEIGKAAALAQAVIDGQAAIVGAYKVGASIGGPPLGAAYGAAAGLATLQNINAIKNQSFGSGGGGAASGS